LEYKERGLLTMTNTHLAQGRPAEMWVRDSTLVPVHIWNDRTPRKSWIALQVVVQIGKNCNGGKGGLYYGIRRTIGKVDRPDQ